MRLIAALAALAALAVSALAGQDLWQVLQEPLPPHVERVALRSETATRDWATASSRHEWPALFGRPRAPEPPSPPTPVAEPQPPAPTQPPAPPIDSLGYSLKGVVGDGTRRWAIVSHPTGEALLKVGDKLGETYMVTAIDASGLWAKSSPAAEAQLLGFAK